MTKAPTTITTIEDVKALAETTSKLTPDETLLDMMPDEMKQLVTLGPKALSFAADKLDAQRKANASAVNDYFQLKAAIQKYAHEKADPLFRQDLELCLEQVRQGR